MEIFKDIEGYENLYQVSNYGNVKSLERYDRLGHLIKEKMLNKRNIKGYLRVCLSKNGKYKLYSVHRLVAQAFLPNPDNLPCVNHKDENPLNNNEDNLEWCTVKYNTNYGTSISRRAKSHSKPINQYDLNGNFIRKWDSATYVEKELGFYHNHITACCKGKLNQAYGYIWKYAEDC